MHILYREPFGYSPYHRAEDYRKECRAPGPHGGKLIGGFQLYATGNRVCERCRTRIAIAQGRRHDQMPDLEYLTRPLPPQYVPFVLPTYPYEEDP